MAYAQIPAFIVTLGGLIAYSGIAFLLAKGETVAPMDKTFEALGGSVPQCSLGPFWSWVVGGHRLCRHYLWHCQRPPAAPALQLSAASRCGPNVFLAASASVAVLRCNLGGEFLSLATEVIENYAAANNITIPPGVENRMAAPSAWPATRSSAARRA